MAQGLLYLSSEGDQLFEVAGGFRSVPVDTPFERLTVVTDFVEEALVRAALPKMGGRDMGSLVQRRLQQEFRETPYRAAIRLGAGKADKTFEYLFIGLPVAQRIDRELKPRAEAGCAVDDVLSISLLVSRWISKARAHTDRRLVVLPTPAGIRHVFVERGQAVLSRLTNSGSQQKDPLASALDELERTVQYLYNARVIERGVSLPTWIWGGDETSKAMLTQRVQGIEFEDSPVVSGLQDPGSLGVQALFALAVRDPGGVQLAPAAIRLHHFARQFRHYLSITAVIAVAALLGMAGLALADTWSARRQAASLLQVQHDVQSEIAALQAKADAATTSADNVRESIASYEREVSAAPDFAIWLLNASRGFDATPAFQLNELRWRTEAMNDSEDSGIGPSSGCPAPFDQSTELDAGLADPNARRTGLLLTGIVDPKLSLREALQARQTFEAALAASAEFVLSSQEAPVDVSGEGAIRGNSAGDDDPRAFDYCLTTPSIEEPSGDGEEEDEAL